MQFGLQHPNFSFEYDGQSNNADISQIADSLKNLITKAQIEFDENDPSPRMNLQASFISVQGDFLMNDDI